MSVGFPVKVSCVSACACGGGVCLCVCMEGGGAGGKEVGQYISMTSQWQKFDPKEGCPMIVVGFHSSDGSPKEC